MLQKLIINNYAIIDRLSLEPDAHLNTVTGETGAGKSIILGALSLILGDRADTSVLINKQEKCVVEAFFDVTDNDAFHLAMQDEELDDDPQCIIRREITTSGKSRAFVNDTPVTLGVLNKLTSLLVDLHQQFGHLALEDDLFQMDVLDAIAQNGTTRKKYSEVYSRYKKCSRELAEYKQQQSAWQKEADYKKYLLDELEQADIKSGEAENAESQLKQLAHAERILSVLQSSHRAMQEGEQPMLNELKRISQQLQTITEVMPGVAPLQERLNAALAELKDIAAELEGLENKVNLDEELMQTLQERIDIAYKLFKKHAVSSTDELIKIREELQNDLKASFDLDDKIASLVKEQEVLLKEVMALAQQLSAARIKVVPQIEERVDTLLVLVGMPNARIKIQLSKEQYPGISGIDKVQFLLDANKSGQFQLMQKAASGGEMSRIMLCIKSLTAKAMQLPTLIFDEVDTGISGEAARQVGILLRDLSQYHQVICITHQPQVAAKGSRHFYVYKDEDGAQRITTKIRILKQEERVLAIARMIGGEQPSEAALQNAKELVTV